jgi:hypothetical protein
VSVGDSFDLVKVVYTRVCICGSFRRTMIARLLLSILLLGVTLGDNETLSYPEDLVIETPQIKEPQIMTCTKQNEKCRPPAQCAFYFNNDNDK